MANRQQRRAAAKKRLLAKKKMIKAAVDKSVHDKSVAIEADIKTQGFIWIPGKDRFQEDGELATMLNRGLDWV